MNWLEVFRQGQLVANPKKWKNAQMGASALSGLLLALYAVAVAKGWIPPGWETVVNSVSFAIASVVFLLFNPAVTVATSDKVGIRPKSGGVLSSEERATPVAGSTGRLVNEDSRGEFKPD